MWSSCSVTERIQGNPARIYHIIFVTHPERSESLQGVGGVTSESEEWRSFKKI